MKKSKIFILITILIFTLVSNIFVVNAQADDIAMNGVYVGDGSENFSDILDQESKIQSNDIVARKQKLAHEYALAKKSKDLKKIEMIFNELDTLNNKVGARTFDSKVVNNILREYMNYIPIVQMPQDRNYYCGYACIQAILNYNNISKDQQTIAIEVWNRPNNSCPWYLIDGSTLDQYVAATYLTSKLNHIYTPYPFGPVGTPTNSSAFVEKVCMTLDYTNNAIMIAGESHPSGPSHLPNYPSNATIRHWMVINGWTNNPNIIGGINFNYVDPAKSPVISWSGQISAYGVSTSNNLYEFSKALGILY